MMVISYTSFLFAVWLLLSGHLEPLMLGLGLVSVLLTVFLVKRMTLIDHESYPLHLSSKIPGFLVFIMQEIVKANIDVIKRILTFKRSSISPQLFAVPASLKSDLGQVIYANSITLTPGTVSVELEQDKILVHALTKEAADELASGEMAKSIPDEVVDDNKTG
ncbi:MAG: Na+/H+ antiporter subunit E [Candidatus Thiodiazotropha sp.]